MAEESESRQRKLTEMQQRFVDCFTSGEDTAGNPGAAARAAGYAPEHAVEIGRQLLAKPHIAVAIDTSLRNAIGTHLTVQAVAVIQHIINNPNAPLKLRGDMAVKVLEFSGLGDRAREEKGRETGLQTKRLTEMTREELQEVISKSREAFGRPTEDGRPKNQLN